MDIFINFLISLTKLFNGNLGISIVFIGIVSRIIFYPFLKTSLKQTQIMKEIKPKLDEVKRKHGHDKSRHAQEQTKIYKEAGLNPAAGCLAPLVQLVVAIVLFNALRSLITTHGINPYFLGIDLRTPDFIRFPGIKVDLPGFLVILTAVATLLQSKMVLPEPVPVEKNDSKKEKEEKQDFSQALTASQGQLVYLFPFLILFSGRIFPAGLALYWLVSTVVALVQQYYITGLGGLKPWVKWLPLKL